jgi:hypothetical protein
VAFITKERARAAAKRAGDMLDSVAGVEYYSDDADDADDADERFDIFLSHSINDQDLVRGVKRLLEDQGHTVYIAWLSDQELDRTHVNKQTADRLRRRMRNCYSLIYIATDNSVNSRWMPWELGYFDGQNGGGVAILPLVDNDGERFNGQEYLGLYPLVIEQDEQVYVEGDTDGRLGLYAFVNDTFRSKVSS